MSYMVVCLLLAGSASAIVVREGNDTVQTESALEASVQSTPSLHQSPIKREKKESLYPSGSHESHGYPLPEYGTYFPDEHQYHHQQQHHHHPLDQHHHHYPLDQQHHHHHDVNLKHFLLPLAGVALIGAAAIFASNPILLQLGVVSGKRRRRALESLYDDRLSDMVALQRFIEQLPKVNVMQQERKLLATYLSCSGASDGTNKCIERITCEVQNPKTNFSRLEKQVLKIVTMDIMQNEYISEDLKFRLKEAEKEGSQSKDCSKYYCSDIDG